MMMLGHVCASALLVALAAAHPAGRLDDRDCGGNCVVVESVATALPQPKVYRQAVVWVDQAGKPVCTVTETVTVTATAVPPPPPPPKPPGGKVVFLKENSQEGTTTTTMTTQSTTTVVVVPMPATALPVVPVPAVSAPAVVQAAQAGGCSGGNCGKSSAITVAGNAGGCQGAGCSQGSQPVPQPAPQPAPQSSSSPVPVPMPAPQSGSDSGRVPAMNIKTAHGVSYAAYRADHNCKTKQDIDDDFDDMKGLYSVVRTYGVDCNQVEYIYQAAKRIGVKVFYGIWDINNVQTEAQKIIQGINGDWSIVDSISVGNELVNNGQASAAQVIAAVKQARSILRSAGYQGPVVAVDTFIATEANPMLCEVSDICAINAHSFFDPTIRADQAGAWLVETVESVRAKLSADKRIIITETGWPTAGSANGLAVPGVQNQKMALESISKAFAENPGDVILFSAFNDLWKGDRDKYWGIGGAVSRCDR